MTFPINKRINTELLMDITSALSIGETWIKVVANECDQPVTLAD